MAVPFYLQERGCYEKSNYILPGLRKNCRTL
nr:MAG TPA: hypothetical protein [Caudoviricetes sp.]